MAQHPRQEYGLSLPDLDGICSSRISVNTKSQLQRSWDGKRQASKGKHPVRVILTRLFKKVYAQMEPGIRRESLTWSVDLGKVGA